MKAVMMSIQPKWCELIASGKKTVEVRKTRPKLEAPFKVYIYCTTTGDLCYKSNNDGKVRITKNTLSRVKSLSNTHQKFCNGKVIGEFVCDTCIVDKTFGYDPLMYAAACMSEADVAWYCTNKEMYGWHISDLVIYDEPKKLSEFYNYKKYDWWDYGHHTNKPQWELRSLSRPPQSWCYVEELV